MLFPCHTNTEIPCSTTEPELDASDEDSIVDDDQEEIGSESDKEGSGIEEGMKGDSDGYTMAVTMPTVMGLSRTHSGSAP